MTEGVETDPPTTEVGPVEFTFAWYGRLLEFLLDRGYQPTTFGEDPQEGELLVRHDVDLSPRKALVVGQLEADRGIEGSYFFLVNSPLYNVHDAPNRRVIAELASLGHEVGVHFSTHQYWDDAPSRTDLVERVAADQRVLSIVDDRVGDAVSFHCPPDWVLDERFDGFTSTYEARYFSEIGYWADSGQRWRESNPVDEPRPASLQLLTHPGLWAEGDETYIERVASETRTHLSRTEQFVTRQMLQEQFAPIEYPSSDLR